MKPIKKARCVACGKVMKFDYHTMGVHAAEPHPGKKWEGFESVDE